MIAAEQVLLSPRAALRALLWLAGRCPASALLEAIEACPRLTPEAYRLPEK